MVQDPGSVDEVRQPGQWQKGRSAMKALLLTLLGVGIALLGLFVVFILAGAFFVLTKAKPDPRVVQALQDAAASGVPIVQAIHEYRNRTGLFPEKLEDLARYATIEIDPGKWTYEWEYWRWSLRYTGSDIHGTNKSLPSLSYHWDHMDRGAGWRVGGRPYMGTQISATTAISDPPQRTARERYEAFLAEIRPRIARIPKNPVHQQGLISRRISEGDLEAALADAIRMHEQQLSPLWERQVISYLLYRLNRDNWALRELAQSAEADPSFVQYFNLAMACKEAGQHKDALYALEQGCKSPFGSATESREYADEYYFCLAAAYAYRQKEYSLAIRICDYWQKHGHAKGYGERSYYAIRGASNLALGNVEAAVPNINMAIAANNEGATWAGDLSRLQAAAQARQSVFSWDPGPSTDRDVSDLLVVYH